MNQLLKLNYGTKNNIHITIKDIISIKETNVVVSNAYEPIDLDLEYS